MSVSLHEAFCLDSFSTQLLFWDDFAGDQLKDEWLATLTSGGTAAVVDTQTGGIIRLGTPTASDAAQLDWGNYRTLHVLKKVTAEARVRANDGVTDTTRRLFGLVYDASNRMMFYHTYDSSTIFLQNGNDGAFTSPDSEVDLDDQFHIYRIECLPAGEVHYYIDNVECANSPITTNIPSDAGDYLQPYFFIATNADTDPATSMDIDYVYVRQER